uniref:nicotinate phosphoribosyltransferase n=1 Tax=Fundulus heteroclitus TaxID=8078 RepID=A0A3Q2P089_FUNHE
MKISEDPEKTTVAGRKAVYRLLDADGHPFLDLLCLKVEPPPEAGCTLTCYPLEGDNAPVSVTPAQVACLQKEVFLKGQVKEPLCGAAETRAKVQSSLQTLHPRHKRLQEPDSYMVRLTRRFPHCHCHSTFFIQKTLRPWLSLPPGGALRETPPHGHRAPKRQQQQQQLSAS